MPQMEELDLTKPGKLWAIPEYETSTTIHMVAPNDNYTKEKLRANPTVAPADQLMAPFIVPHGQLDKEGRAVLDLEKSGRAKEIMGKLEQRMHDPKTRLDSIRALFIAAHAEGNHVPDDKAFEVMDFSVANIPTITLLGTQIYVTVQNFKTGTREYLAEIKVTEPLKEVKITTEVASDMAASTGQRGNGSMVIPVKEGQPVTLRVAVKFDTSIQERQVIRLPQPGDYQHYVAGGWRTSAGANNPDRYMDTERQEIWKGQNHTLKVTGTGPYEGIVKSITIRSEDWAAGWLWKNPPRVFGHNVC